MSRLSDDHAFWERMERRERRARAARRWGIRLVFAALTLLWIVDVADRLTQRGAARCTGGSQVRVSLTYARAIFCFAGFFRIRARSARVATLGIRAVLRYGSR